LVDSFESRQMLSVHCVTSSASKNMLTRSTDFVQERLITTEIMLPRHQKLC